MDFARFSLAKVIMLLTINKYVIKSTELKKQNKNSDYIDEATQDLDLVLNVMKELYNENVLIKQDNFNKEKILMQMFRENEQLTKKVEELMKGF